MNKYDSNTVYLQSKSGDEKFTLDNNDLDFDLKSYWSYSYSNVWNQTGELAEFLVAKALEGDDTYTRNHEFWAVWDLNYKKLRIEVKATADFHTWNITEKKKTPRSFDIHKVCDRGYILEEPETKGTMRRLSQIYVFCHNKCPMGAYEPANCNPLNLENWDFYILPTSTIDDCCGNQKTISLGRLRRIHKHAPYRFDEIKDVIDQLCSTIMNKKKHLSRIKTNRYEKDLEMTVRGNEYAFSHPEEHCIKHFGLPVDMDFVDNLSQIEGILNVDGRTAFDIYEMCFDCYYYETLNHENGVITCGAVKHDLYFRKFLASNCCKMKKKSKDELSEFEKYLLKKRQ